MYYSENRPLPIADCLLLPQSGMQTAGKFAVRTRVNACDTKMFLGLHVLLILSSGLERVTREMLGIARVYPSNDCELAKYTKTESVQIETV